MAELNSNEEYSKPRRGNKYIPIANSIRDGILKGTLNGRLPSVPILAKKNDTTQATMHKALTLLRKEGFLHTITGSGTYVIPLKRARTHSLGIIVPGTEGALARRLIGAVQRAAQPHQLSIRVESKNDHGDSHIKAAQALLRKPMVDGIIIWTPEPAPDLIEFIENKRTPLTVLSEVKIPLAKNCSCIFLTNTGAASDTMMHLITSGYRKIGFLTNQPKAIYSIERYEQFVRSQRAADLEPGPLIVVGQKSLESPLKFSPSDIKTLSKLDAVFCVQDGLAMEILRLCLRMGWKVPDDLAVAGFDNTRNTAQIGLTTVDSHYERAGSLAVDTILKYIEGQQEDPISIEVQSELIIRGSTRKEK